MKLGMKSYIQIMIKSLNLAKNFKLMLPLSFNIPVCLIVFFTILSLGLKNEQAAKNRCSKTSFWMDFV